MSPSVKFLVQQKKNKQLYKKKKKELSWINVLVEQLSPREEAFLYLLCKI